MGYRPASDRNNRVGPVLIRSDSATTCGAIKKLETRSATRRVRLRRVSSVST